MRIIFAALLGSLSPNAVAANLIEYETHGVVFYYQSFEEMYPMLRFFFGSGNGRFLSDLRGEGYLSCWPGRIDMFRLNMLLDSPIADLLADSESAFMGVQRGEWPGNGVVGSRPMDKSSELPEAFGASRSLSVSMDVVLPFNPLEVSDSEKLYVTSFPDAVFVQGMADGGMLGLYYYQESERRYYELFRIKLSLNGDQLRGFLASCLNSN